MAPRKKAAEKGGEKKRKHLHRHTIEQAEDGSFVHHETYKPHKGATETEPERRNVATSQTPEEAGQFAADRFAQNDMSEAPAEPAQPGPEAAGGGAVIPGM
jgi:hypothetical protein